MLKLPRLLEDVGSGAETTAALAESENGKAYLQLNNYSSV